jgi:hypothetical protein
MFRPDLAISVPELCRRAILKHIPANAPAKYRRKLERVPVDHSFLEFSLELLTCIISRADNEAAIQNISGLRQGPAGASGAS